MTAPAFPLAANGAMYEPSQVDEYLAMLFRHVDWQPGQVISLLGIGEKGTTQEGVFRDRQLVAPGFLGAVHGHLKRWAQHHVAGFIVPAVLHADAHERKGGGALDKVAAHTAIILDIDNGDVRAVAKYVTDRLGKPTMIVASGGVSADGQRKAHLYWLLNEPSEDIERVAALRKLLAAKVGGDQSFGRATQVIRIPGTVHAKNGKATVCTILDRQALDYDLDELADIIEGMQPMPGLPVPQAALPMLSMIGGMDFTPRQDTAVAALHRDVPEGGEELTRWSEFSKVAGFHIAEARAGRVTPVEAYEKTQGWMLTHMLPVWPAARFEQEFRGLFERDLENHGAFLSPQLLRPRITATASLPLEFFDDIVAPLSNRWRVRNLFPAVGLGLVYGSPGAGKSFYALDLALRVAAGWEIDGRSVLQCPVVYIGAEGQNGLRSRVAAFRKFHAVAAGLPFVLLPCAVDLQDPNADLQRVILAVRRATEQFGETPGLIVVDTIAATFGGGDENGKDMIAFTNNLAHLRDEFAALVLAVHHRPKDQTNDTPRGHGSLIGTLDTVVRIDGGSIRSATVTKQKDAEMGQPTLFALQSVSLGVDEEGEPVLGAVVKYLTAVVDQIMSKAASEALLALGSSINDAGVSGVSEEVWQAKWAEGRKEDEKRDTRLKAWSRARKAIGNTGKVRCVDSLWQLAASVDQAPTADQATDFNPTTTSD